MSSWELLGWVFVLALIVMIALLVYLVVVATVRSLRQSAPPKESSTPILRGRADR